MDGKEAVGFVNYEGFTGTYRQYLQVFSVLTDSISEARSLASEARLRGGVFWSEKKQRVLTGTFANVVKTDYMNFELKIKLLNNGTK